jgi:hypothetical protein
MVGGHPFVSALEVARCLRHHKLRVALLYVLEEALCRFAAKDRRVRAATADDDLVATLGVLETPGLAATH